MTMKRKVKGRPVTKSQRNKLSVLGKGVAKAALRNVPGVGAIMGIADVVGSLRGGGKGEGAPRKASRSRAVFMKKGRVFIGFSAKEVKRALRRKSGGPTKIIPVRGGI